MSVQLRRTRPPRLSTHYEPCEFERNRPDYVEEEDGTIRATRAWYCFHYLGAGERSTCPFPARMCRPKLHLEGAV